MLLSAARPAVFLDRDGVLNRALIVDRKPYAPRHLADFRLLPGAARAVDRLRAAGYVVVVVTNQPDIGNGLVDPAEVEAMNARLRHRVAVDDIRVCPHRQDAGCHCRKPRPGMLLDAAAALALDLGASWMVGDRWGDVEAGKAAGCRTIKIRRGYAEDRKPGHPAADAVATTLPAAVDIVLAADAQSTA